MKNRIVIWGKNDGGERVLIALELKPEANKVNLHTFPEAVASDDFTKKMMDTWRSGGDVEFPEGTTTVERDLAVTESLLPDNLKVDRSDVINRAQSEWHFVVLSHKMSQVYQSELADLREKVNAMQGYDKKMWDSVKQFWDKVSNQVKDRNLFREHSDTLRDGINEVFEQLKTLRSEADSAFKGTSSQVVAELNGALDGIEAKLKSGGGRFANVFDDLRALQSKFRQAKMTREDSDAVWARLDKAFKAAKERRFGPGANDGSLAERHERRLAGLIDAIKKMQHSVDRDAEDLKYEERRIAASEGQLEAQIRTAKIKMVRERLESKREKLADMKKTEAEVLAAIAQAKSRDEKRKEKEQDRAKFEEAKEAAKARIDAEAKSHGPAEKGSIEKAVDTAVDFAADAAEKGKSVFGALQSVLGEVMEDLSDSVSAVGSVAAGHASEAIDNVKVKAKPMVDAATEAATDAIEKATEKAKTMGDQLSAKAEPVVEKVVEQVEHAVENITEKAGPMAKALGKKLKQIADAVEDAIDKIDDDDADEKPAKKSKKSAAKPAEDDDKDA